MWSRQENHHQLIRIWIWIWICFTLHTAFSTLLFHTHSSIGRSVGWKTAFSTFCNFCCSVEITIPSFLQMNVSNNNLFLIKMIYLIRRAMLVCTTRVLEPVFLSSAPSRWNNSSFYHWSILNERRLTEDSTVSMGCCASHQIFSYQPNLFVFTVLRILSCEYDEWWV